MAEVRKLALALTSSSARFMSKAMHVLPDAWYYRANHLLRTKRILHLKNPRTFSEKIQWLKLYGPLDQYGPYADKYEVRKYVEDTVGPQYLVPLIGVWTEFDEIPFDELPRRFVLKATHGQGYNFICRDKTSLDLASLRDTVTRWTSESFYRAEREPQYRDIQPRLIAEAYLEDESGALRDYKFTCFDGIVHMLEVMSDRAHGMTVNLYDRHWNLLPIHPTEFPNAAGPITKPTALDDMFDVVGKLSAIFPFVRVDLYYADGRIYFGELTFTPSNGTIRYEPASFNRELDGMLDLSNFRVTASSRLR
ncbi:MAG: ATP-grasp fold amidoligase family protein [Streptosporangiaceae bacterium]